MRAVRSWGLLGALAGWIGSPAWSAEPYDPPFAGNLPIFTTTAPIQPAQPPPRRLAPALPTQPVAVNPPGHQAWPAPSAPLAATLVVEDEPREPGSPHYHTLEPAELPDNVVRAERPELDTEVLRTQIPAPSGLPQPRTPATPSTPDTTPPGTAPAPAAPTTPPMPPAPQPAPAPAVPPAPPQPAPAMTPEAPQPAPAVTPAAPQPAPAVTPAAPQPAPAMTPEAPQPAPAVTPAGPASPAPAGPPAARAAIPPTTPPATTGAGEDFARISAMNLTGQPRAAGLGYSDAPIMLGDQAPFSGRVSLAAVAAKPPPPPNPPQPPVPPVPGTGPRKSFFVPWVRGFKIADNQSPRPQDRFFFSFDYFNNLNGVVNQALNSPLSHEKVYRELFGFEKTFFNGNASIGLRMPLNTLVADTNVVGLGGTNTALGNLTVFAKLILWQDPSERNLISGGLSVTSPTGPTNFAGAPSAFGFRDVQIQPFIGYIFSRDRWYIQGFEAIDVPTDSRDVTLNYNDIGIGYFIYRDANPNALISSIAPTFETHINVPLNHRGAFRAGDPAGTPDVVDLTYGMNVLFRRRAMLSAGFINPVTGPRPFSYEWQLLLNVYFGRTRSRASQITPTPPLGGN